MVLQVDLLSVRKSLHGQASNTMDILSPNKTALARQRLNRTVGGTKVSSLCRPLLPTL